MILDAMPSDWDDTRDDGYVSRADDEEGEPTVMVDLGEYVRRLSGSAAEGWAK